MLFSDIAGSRRCPRHASRGHRLDAQQLLREYVEIIFKHEGTLDKFVGDEIMALFGAPVGHPDDPVRAVRTALEMLASLRKFNADRAAEGKRGFEIGIGINTGDVVAGYLGSSKAMQYTVIGAPVNLAARLARRRRNAVIVLSRRG